MNIFNLRSSLPPIGNSVLAHRLRIDIAPSHWLTVFGKWGRIALTLWFTFQFIVGCFNPFGKPVGVGSLIAIAIGFALFLGLNMWLSRYDPRVLALLTGWFRPSKPLTSEFRDWNDLTTRLATSSYVVQTSAGASAGV